MGKKTIFLQWSIFLLCFQTTSAQKKTDPLAGKFDNSIVARVAEVTMSTNISPDKQLLLAKYYVRRDSLMAQEVRSGRSLSSLGELKEELARDFNALFTTKELDAYHVASHKDYMQWEASQTAAWLRKKYNARPEIQTIVYKFNLEKNENLLKIFSTQGETDVSNFVSFIINRYDSISAVYKVAAAGEEFLDAKIKLLDAVLPLNETDKKSIRNNYLHLCLKQGADYSKNFQTALQHSVHNKAYFDILYRDSIDQVISDKSKKELHDITFKYGLPVSVANKLLAIIKDKNNAEVELEVSMPYGIKRDSLQRENYETHWAAMKKVLIRDGYYRLSNSRFVYAMRYEKLLKLSPAQMDSLAFKNYQMDIAAYKYSLIDPWEKYDETFFTTYQLERILGAGQYDTLLQIESRPKALSKSKNDWHSLQQSGLSGDYDSASTHKQLYAYHLVNSIIARRYANNASLSKKLMNEAIQRKPLVLKKLEAISKMNEYDTAATQ